MYQKLALRNIQRSIKDYIIYFVTITLTASLMYSFLALGLSEEILSMSENMSMLTSGILGLSVIVAFIASFVIRYAVRFMLTQRKKEFATYELLGMETRSIQKLFFVENGIIGLLACLLGILAGTAVSGLLVQLIHNIFGLPHSYQLSFSVKALCTTLLLFSLMYGLGIVRAVRIIRRSKIVELLYGSRKNEIIKNRQLSFGYTMIALSLISMAAGGLLLAKGLSMQTNSALLVFLGAAILLVSGIYGLYRHIPYLVLAHLRMNNHFKYENTNLFYLGQIGRKIQSAGKIMAVTAILLTLSLATMFIGLVIGTGYKANMEAYYPYDAGIALDAPFSKESLNEVLAFTNEKCPIQDHIAYYLYTTENYPIEVLSLSDYNHLRQMLGLEQVILPADRYIVHCDTWNYEEPILTSLKSNPEISLAGTQLLVSEHGIYTEPMELYQMAGTNGYVLVVPDTIASQLSGNKVRLIMKLKNSGYPELKHEIRSFLQSGNWNPQLQQGKMAPERITMGVTVKAWGVENSLTGFTAISFCGLYLSVIFIILSCTVLAFEQLSMSDRNMQNYRILDNMGVGKERQRKLIQKEIGTFFFIPAILPAIITVILIIGANSLYGEAILQKNLIPFYGTVTLLIFFFLYMVYFLATSSVYKRFILK